MLEDRNTHSVRWSEEKRKRKAGTSEDNFVCLTKAILAIMLSASLAPLAAAPPTSLAALQPNTTVSSGASSSDATGLRVLNFHVHKAGGTSMCEMARLNHESTTSENCNLEYTRYGFNGDKEAMVSQSASAQQAYLRASSATFGANECIAPRELPKGLVLMAALREPLERAASHYYFDAGMSPNQLPDTVTSGMTFNDFVQSHVSDDDYTKYYFTNYMTRYFSSTTHARPIGQAELARAKTHIDALDVLVDLDNFEGSIEQLKGALPSWERTDLPSANHGGGGSRTVEMDAAAHKQLRDANALDIELYEHFQLAAATKANARRAARLAAIDSSGDLTSSNMTNVLRSSSAAVDRAELERRFHGDSIRIVVKDR